MQDSVIYHNYWKILDENIEKQTYISELSEGLMISDKIQNISRLRCPIGYVEEEFFFSLVDYRNNYFTSNDPNKIIEFYNDFQNRDQLIQWMKERPRGVSNIIEIDGNKDIVVVIPTADFNGKYAKECRDNIFNGLHIVFIESGGRGDFYFNFAHNVNVGIRKAMEYNPKWVVVSNDDMIKSDPMCKIKDQLLALDNEKYDAVFTLNGIKTATRTLICKFSVIGNIINSIITYTHIYKLIKNDRMLFFATLQLMKKFRNEFVLKLDLNRFENILFKRLNSYYNFEAFGIFSARFINQSTNLLDETYINDYEDQDLSILINSVPERLAWIDYDIRGQHGMTIGQGINRKLRDVASLSYFNLKMEKGVILRL